MCCIMFSFIISRGFHIKHNHGFIANQCNIFTSAFLKIHYKVDVGGGTAIAETPEMERVKRNQQTISTVHCGVTLPQPFPLATYPCYISLLKIA